MLSDSTLAHEVWGCPPLWSAGHWGVIDRHGVITHAELWLATDRHSGMSLLQISSVDFRNRSAGNPCQRRSLFGPKSEPGLPEKNSKKWDFTFAKLMANCASNCCPEQISLTLYQVMRKSKWTPFTFLRGLSYIQYKCGLIDSICCIKKIIT